VWINAPNQLKRFEISALHVGALAQQLDQRCVLTIPQGIRIEAQVDIERTGMRHLGIVEQ